MGKGGGKGGAKHSLQHKFQASYHEKRAHKGKGHTAGHGGLSWGTQDLREGSDARGNYDACVICLHSADDPLMDPDGHIYCKGCIYAFLLKAKQDQKAQLEAYEKQEREKEEEHSTKQETQQLQDILSFKSQCESATTSSTLGVGDTTTTNNKRKAEELTIADAPTHTKPGAVPKGYKKHKTPDGKEIVIIDRDFVRDFHTGGMDKEEKQKNKDYLPSFWVPSLIPDVHVKKVEKPAEDIKGPFGNKLKRKDLTPVQYTPNPDYNKATSKEDEKYMCPVSRKTLTNAAKVYLIKTTGDVVGLESLKILLSDGSFKGKKLKKKHIVEFANNGTGYAAGGAKLVKKYTQALLC